MHDKETVLKALGTVYDPDLRRDLVSLGMIKNLEISEGKVAFQVELTTPACPLKNEIKQNCISAIHTLISPELDVDVEMTSRVTTQKDRGPLLKNVKNIIAVASGKGGVGKSTIAVNLAIALGKTGAKVGLMDADIYGPSIPLMFDEMHAKPVAIEKDGKELITPVEKYGIKILSVGFFVDPDKALIWRGPMASNALNQLFSESDWGELDYMIVDLPPGTGDIHLTLVQNLAVTGAVIVTTPQEVALADARKAVGMFNSENINVPILGLVENMAWFTPEELPKNRYYIFGREGGKQIAAEYDIPFLGQIPLVQSIREGGDDGIPAALDSGSVTGAAFADLATATARQVSIRNATKAPTKQVEINT